MTPNGGDNDGGVGGEAFGLEEHDAEAAGSLGRRSRVVKARTGRASVTCLAISAGVLSGLAVVSTAPRDMVASAAMAKWTELGDMAASVATGKCTKLGKREQGGRG